MIDEELRRQILALFAHPDAKSQEIIRCVEEYQQASLAAGRLNPGEISGMSRRARRDDRKETVLEYLKDFPNWERLTLDELTILLNESPIQPARGGEWSRFMVHRLIGKGRFESE